MKVDDTIAVPGYGEYKLALGDNACAGCVAEKDWDLCWMCSEEEYVDNTPLSDE